MAAEYLPEKRYSKRAMREDITPSTDGMKWIRQWISRNQKQFRHWC